MEAPTMQKLIAALSMWLIASTGFAQFEYADKDKPTLGQAVSVSDLKLQLAAEQEKVRQLQGELEALKTKAKSRPTCTIVSWESCPACPAIIADMTPWLSTNWDVVLEKHPAGSPQPGAIYPFFKFCDGDKCWAPIYPQRGQRVTRAWLEQALKHKLLGRTTN